MLGNSGGTFHAVPGVIAMFCGGPLVSYYYIVKDLQLYYLISWGEAKLKKNNYERIKQFYRFRFLLDFRCYLAGMFAVLVVTLIPAIYTLMARDAFKDAMTLNSFSTLRCEWYHIPGVCFTRCAWTACFGCCSSRSEEHTSELQSLMRISYAVFCLKKKNKTLYQIVI